MLMELRINDFMRIKFRIIFVNYYITSQKFNLVNLFKSSSFYEENVWY
jgi:hypothetical protein